jgi:membrane-bound ClpP family serine protease
MPGPDGLVLLLALGLVLIFVEANLPGRVLPGAAGLLLVLLGVAGFAELPLNFGGLLLLGGAALFFAAAVRWSAWIAPAGVVAGTAGLRMLVEPTASRARVHGLTAAAASTTVGVLAVALGRVALRARRNKTAVERNLAAERWGEDAPAMRAPQGPRRID